MITYYIVRHGQKEPTFGDPSLTAIGIQQARATGELLRDKQIAHIYASPRKRTIQTAGEIGKILGLPIIMDTRLRERMDWDKPGESREAFFAEWQKTDRDRNYIPIHGDSAYESGRRFVSFLEDMEKAIHEGNIVIVTHGGITGDLLRNLFPEQILPFVENPEYQTKYIDILECSLTVLMKDKGNYTIGCIGDTHHLSLIRL